MMRTLGLLGAGSSTEGLLAAAAASATGPITWHTGLASAARRTPANRRPGQNLRRRPSRTVVISIPTSGDDCFVRRRRTLAPTASFVVRVVHGSDRIRRASLAI